MVKLIAGLLISLVMHGSTCHPPAQKTGCFKGRLEVKGLCSNYTIKIVEGTMDTASKMAVWVDENTGKSHTNVFALGNPCSFPANIKEGDEFYFTISSTKDEQCNVCMAYYPVPPRRNSVTVLQKPCTQ